MTSHLFPSLLAGLLAATGCATAQPALKEACRDAFLIGAALNEAQFSGEDVRSATLVKTHFNSITSENVLKWEVIHPEPDRYEFSAPDRYVEFGERNHMFIVGHTLVWHNQTPEWVFEGADGKQLTREALLLRMREHIHTVVGRYKGRINGWDVVNEALNEDGTLRRTPWLTIIGEDYLEKAFAYAREADPTADLYYNDYSLENAPKREGAVALIRKLQASGVKVSGIGTQQHLRMDSPTLEQVDDTLTAFSKLGIKVMVTELDVDVLPAATEDRGAEISLRVKANTALNPYVDALPASVQRELTERYAGLFAVYMKHHKTLDRVTLWGVTDADSWLNNWPVPGRTSYPLLFDRKAQPKPGFRAVIRTVSPVLDGSQS